MFLSSSFVGSQIANAQHTQDGKGFPLASGVNIVSPSNTTYLSAMPTLNVTIKGWLSPAIYNFEVVYSIDGKPNATLPVTTTFVPVEAMAYYADGTTGTVTSSFASYYLISGGVELQSLSEGSHWITVYSNCIRFNNNNTNWSALIYDSNTVYFR